MKTHSSLRYATNALLVASMSTYLISPFTVSAVTSPEPTSNPSANECTKVQSFGQTALANIQAKLAKVNSDASSDATKRLTDEQNYDAKVAADWAKWDAVRQQNFTSLNNKATTAAQKQAVATFEQQVLGYVSTRRAAVTAARQTFRGAVASEATARLNGVDSAISQFETAVSTAVANAETNCSTESPSTVRTTFVAALKSAKSTFQANLAALPKLGPAIAASAQVRDKAVQAADNTFKQNVQLAANALKKALGQS
jgi:hypothetical protein